MIRISAAFLPLTDAAVLMVADSLGFARDEGIELVLVRDTSWANIRDRLVYGQVQAAHMLGPLAVAVSLGIGQYRCRLLTPFKLGMNGTALTVSRTLAAALDPDPLRRVADPLATAHDFAAAIGLHRRKPIIGVVHRFSSSALLLRYWLASAGVDPDRDIVFRVLAPLLMGEALHSSEIDGFFAAEPWSSAAVACRSGEIIATSSGLWRRGVEKVLALREDWAEANPQAVDALVRALDRAARWCDDPANHAQLAELIAAPRHLGLPAEIIRGGLDGAVALTPGAAPTRLADLLIFNREAANFPWRSQALWIYSQLVRWGFVAASEDAARAAAGVFRPDLYRRALAGGTTPLPGASAKLEGALDGPLGVGSKHGALTLGPDRFFDERVFDPTAIGDYLDGFATPSD